jgi:hypothetical protein
MVRRLYAVFLLSGAMAAAPPAETFTDGEFPAAALIQGADGNLSKATTTQVGSSRSLRAAR